MNEWFTMEVDEVLNEAIMSETPMLVVEGIDDISVYEGICSQTGKSVEVVAVQNLKNMSEGNRGVVEFIKELYELDYDGKIEDYILGVIDRDSRYYRGELLDMPALFILKWYSMESHFITKESIRIVIKQCTRTQEKLLTEELLEHIYTHAVNDLMSLFYLSLECLKTACVTGYSSVASYKMNIPHLRNLGVFEYVEDKKNDLNDFAQQKSITYSFLGLLDICKGKWLLNEFTRILIQEIKNLKVKCMIGEIDKCQFCHTGRNELCLYGFEGAYNESQISNIIKKNEGFTEFAYLKNRIANMI